MRRYKRVRNVTYGLFTPGAGPDPLGAWVDLGIMLLIVANVTAVILGTVDTIAAAAGDFLWYFEVFSVAIFTIEYLARVWSAVEAESFEGPLSGRVEFASRPLMIIDLLAILPFYLTAAGLTGVDLRLIRALRLFRLFRLLKLARYSTAMSSLTATFRAKREKLVLTLFVNILLLVLASSAMYYAEHTHQPEEFSSIPATFY